MDQPQYHGHPNAADIRRRLEQYKRVQESIKEALGVNP